MIPLLASAQVFKLNQISSTTQAIPFFGVIMGDGSPLHTATASSSPTIGSINATSTILTSNFAGLLSIKNWILATSTTLCIAPETCQFQVPLNSTATGTIFQNAIDSVTGYGGGTINIKHGIYDIGDLTPVLGNNERLIGESASSTILLNNLIRVYGDNQEVANLTVNPQGRTAGSFKYDGLQLEGPNKYIHDVSIQNWTNYGIDITGYSSTYGSSTNQFIDHVSLNNYGSYHTNGGEIILLGGYYNVHITNSYFGTCTNNCQFLEVFLPPNNEDGFNSNFWFENNDIEGPFSKTAYFIGKNIHILNNEFKTTWQIASWLGTEGAVTNTQFATQDVQVRGNTFDPNLTGGVESNLQLVANPSYYIGASSTLINIDIDHNTFNFGHIELTQVGTSTIYNNMSIENNIFNRTATSFVYFGVSFNPATSTVVDFEGLHIHDNSFVQWGTGAGLWGAINLFNAGSYTYYNNVDIYNNHFLPIAGASGNSLRSIFIEDGHLHFGSPYGTTTGEINIYGNTFASTTQLDDYGVNNYNNNFDLTSTSTNSGGINLLGGCYAMNGTCLPTGAITNYWTKVGNDIANNNSGRVGIGSSTPDSGISINNNTGRAYLHVGDSQNIGNTKLLIENGWTANDNQALLIQRNATTPQFVVTGAGRTGIGTSTPNNVFDVSGSGVFGADYYTTAPSNGLLVEGNVGVGTTSPATTFSVNGKIYSGTGGFQFPDGTIQTTAVVAGSNYWTLTGSDISNNNGGRVGVGSSTPDSGVSFNLNAGRAYVHIGDSQNIGKTKLLIENGWTGNDNTAFLVQRNNTTPQFEVTGAGNVGIGTSTPGSQLSIGNIGGINFFPAATSTFGSSANGINLTNGCFAISSTCLSLSTLSGTLTVAKGGTNATSFAPNSIITSDAAGTTLIATGTQLTVGNINATTTATSTFGGALGIGTTSPYAKLAVQATANQTNSVFEVASSSNATKYLSVSGTGFGTTTLSGLNISGSATSTSNVGFNIINGCYSINNICISGGTVSSVTLSVPSFLSIAGSPITTSGTLAITLSGTALPVANGGTGQTSFGQGWLNSDGTTITSSTSPTVATITATSTTINNYFAGNIALASTKILELNGNDTNHGILYSSAVDGPEIRGFSGMRFTFGSNGASESARFSSDRFGIGTTSPSYARFGVKGAGTGTGYTAVFSNSANLNLFVLQDNGNIGIGTTSPSSTLSIAGKTNLFPFTISSTTGTLASSTLYAIDQAGDVHFGGGTPILSGCGTGAQLDANSTDQVGTIIPGAAAAGCTLTFSTAKLSAPHCQVSQQSMSLVNALSYTETASALTITQTALSGRLDYSCPLGH